VSGVSVVIPTAGGRAGILERSLDVILDDPATGEALVVVDAIDAPTEELLRRRSARDSRLRLVPASENRGGLDRGQANRNAGVREAKGELILAIDDDVEPEPGLVSAHAARQAANERLVLLGYMPVAPSTDRRATRATALLYSQVYERECRAFESAPDLILLRLWGGNMSMPRHAWLAAANELSVGAYHVDREFGLRLRALGMKGAFDRRLRAVHHYRRTPAELLDDALSSGIGQARLHVFHPELSEFEPAPTLATGARSVLWRGRSRARMRAVGRSVALAADVAAFARVSPLEGMLVRAIWALGFGRGVYEATTTP
jgi:glycosyltransferase involved in cell wall biosynthesis